MRFDEHREHVDQLLVQRDLTEKQLQGYHSRFQNLEQSVTEHENVRLVIQKAAAEAQSKLAEQLSGIVTTALGTVFDEPYEFLVKFVERRNTTEVDLKLVRNGMELDPLNSCGHGVADICSIALRVAYLLLSDKRSVLILDEPCRQLDTQSRDRVVELLKHIRNEFGVQFIIITHAPELVRAGDRVFKVTNQKGISTVTQVEVA